MQRIETQRLVLRPFRWRDAAAASYNSTRPVVAHYMSDMVMKTHKDARRWIRWVNKKLFDIGKPCVMFAVQLKSNRKVIGCVFVHAKPELDYEVELAYLVVDEYQGKGYATEAGGAMLQWVFANTGLPYLVAIVKHDNPASIRVIEKLNFAYGCERRIDYDGKMTDFHYYRLEKPGAAWPEH